VTDRDRGRRMSSNGSTRADLGFESDDEERVRETVVRDTQASEGLEYPRAVLERNKLSVVIVIADITEVESS
jgi:hypothetical protein